MTAPKFRLFSKLLPTKLLGWEPFWLLILAPMVLLPGRLITLAAYPYLVILLGLFWPLRWLIYRRALPTTPINWSIGLILCWLPVNFWASIDKRLAWQSVGYLVFGIAIFVALVDWEPARQHPQRLVWLLLLINVGLAILGPLVLTADLLSFTPLMVVQAKLHPLTTRLGETINPNILAGSLVLAMPIQVALILGRDWAKSWWLTLGLVILCVGTGAILLLTVSRGAYLAVIVAILVVLLLRWPQLLYSMPFVILVIALCIHRLGALEILKELTFNAKLGGLDQRAEIWSRAYYALQDFTLTGIGIGNFSIIIPQLYPYFSILPTVDVPHAHNLFLQIGIDLGLPGLIAYLAVFINVFVMLISVLRQRVKRIEWTLAAGTVGSLIAMLLHGMVDAPLWGTKLAFLPWLLFAFATLLYSAEQPTAVHHVVE